MKPDWWPEWQGETIVIVASGPSATTINLEIARGRAKFIAVNNSWRLAPWADILHACDAKWWNHAEGCPEFSGLKLTVDQEAATKWGLGYVKCMKPDDRIYMEPLGTVGWGGNSGFHCLNLAAQFGAEKIILVGFDMHVNAGRHWHDDHPEGMHNPTAGTSNRWRKSVDAARKAIPRTTRIFNCSPHSALRNYPKMTFEEALAR